MSEADHAKKKGDLKNQVKAHLLNAEQKLEDERAEQKKDLEEELKRWEESKADRIKKFLESRESSSDKPAGGDSNMRKRAFTVSAFSGLKAGPPPVSSSNPPRPNFALSQKEKIEEKEKPSESKKQKRVLPPHIVQQLQSRPHNYVPLPQAHRLTVEELFDFDDGKGEGLKPNINKLRDHFLQEGKLTREAALLILSGAEEIMRREPNLLQLEAPISIVGDIHGQYFDLVHLIEQCGDPSSTQYLFMGDYVDRGTFGCEVALFLFAFKILYPNTFFMMRGNHESRLLTSHFNFKLECFHKYDGGVYDAYMNTFDCLPVAAVITNSQGNFFCTHGGLSPDIVQLDGIDDFDRFMEPPEGGPLCDLLWSDPIEESTALGLTEDDMEEWYEIDYVPNPTRGCGYIFGYSAIAPFLENNNLLCVIRAHEVQKEGYHCHYFWKRDLELPLAITVFSAPNYCDMYGNLAGYIRLDEHDFDFGQVTWVEHPYTLPNSLNAITYSLPYALEAFTRSVAYILEGCMQELEFLEEENSAEAAKVAEETDEEIRQKVQAFGKMSVLVKKIRERREDILAGKIRLGDEVSKFDKALEMDALNEKARPKDQHSSSSSSTSKPVSKQQEAVVRRQRTRTIH